MDERDKAYLQHISDSIKNIEVFIRGKTFEQFKTDRLLQNGVIRELEIIGEAVARLSEGYTAAHPNIQWRDVVNMRNKLIHDYMGVDLEVVWSTAHEDLPMLQKNLTS